MQEGKKSVPSSDTTKLSVTNTIYSDQKEVKLTPEDARTLYNTDSTTALSIKKRVHNFIPHPNHAYNYPSPKSIKIGKEIMMFQDKHKLKQLTTSNTSVERIVEGALVREEEEKAPTGQETILRINK